MQKSQPSSPTQSSPSSKPSKRGCNCKNSKCLKLYCECFALGEYCNNCNCLNCHNNSTNETSRKEAIQSVLERNPQAFRPKISQIFPSKAKDLSRHSKGCACRRTGCLKKYCECYQAGISCSDMCKCLECKNDYLSFSDLPLKRVLFRPESVLTQVAKEFIENSLASKEVDKNECFLMCQEEILASDHSPYPDSPRKKVFTYSSEFKQFELALFDNLIAAIHKVGG